MMLTSIRDIVLPSWYLERALQDENLAYVSSDFKGLSTDAGLSHNQENTIDFEELDLSEA
jgi:hypothetical protein